MQKAALATGALVVEFVAVAYSLRSPFSALAMMCLLVVPIAVGMAIAGTWARPW